jgi:hypothetical protein
MAANVFDQAARYCVQADPLGFLRWLLHGLDPALRFHGWLDTRTLPFPGTPDRTCDTVADLAYDAASDRRWAVITEFQTDPESEILDRLLEYVARIRRALRCGLERRAKFQVIAALVNLTGPPQPDTLEMALPGLASPALRFQVATCTVRDEDAALSLERIDAGEYSLCLLCWISLMRGGADPAIIERWREVARNEPDDSLRATYGAIVILFAELTDCVPQWQLGLEGWNMRESNVVAEWKAEGRAEGRAEARRSDLREVLEQRFGAPIPSDLAATIEAQVDLDVLSRWFKTALRAESLDGFRSAITQPGTGAAEPSPTDGRS